MNIFVVDPNPEVCAKALDDLRLNKMILETAQLLSTALRVRHTSMPVYKSTHVNHPCSIWTRENKSNYSWLLKYFNALLMERIARTGKGHKSSALWIYFADGVKLMPDGEMTPFANCTPHKNTGTFDAYKLTLKDKWASDKRQPTWKNGYKPTWA